MIWKRYCNLQSHVQIVATKKKKQCQLMHVSIFMNVKTVILY
jgi:hypothetical protein